MQILINLAITLKDTMTPKSSLLFYNALEDFEARKFYLQICRYQGI